MIRNLVGSVLALIGATAAVWSPFRAWYDGRHGRDYPVADLFTGITDDKAELIGSLLLPFAFAALLVLLGVVLRSRLLVGVAGVVVIGFTILWMVRVGQAEGGLSVTGDGRGLGDGVANALGGGALILIGALVMAGRAGRAARDRAYRTDRADDRVDRTAYPERPGRPAGPEGPGEGEPPPEAYPGGAETRTMPRPDGPDRGRDRT